MLSFKDLGSNIYEIPVLLVGGKEGWWIGCNWSCLLSLLLLKNYVKVSA